jgi:hypothetical protein
MARTSTTPHREILEAALQGLEAQKEKLEEQISQVRGLLRQRSGRAVKSTAVASATSGNRPKRVLSAEARKRIAAAQKKRWAAYRKAN